MRNRSFPLQIVGWFVGIAVWLAATSGEAQPPDLGPPLGAGQDNAGLSLTGADGVLGEGNRVPKLEAGFTTPGADQTAQLFISATLPPGSHTYSITQPPGGPLRTKIAVDPSPDVLKIGEFRSVVPPDIEHDEDAFPGLALESHSGTVKWVATIQMAPGIRPEAVKIQGKVNMQLCDAKGCVQPKDYPFTAGVRADVQAVGESAPKRTAETPPSVPVPVPPPSNVGSPIPSPPANTAAPSNTMSPAPPRNDSNVMAPTPPKPPATVKRPEASAGGEIQWIPFTNVSDLGQMIGPVFDVEQVRESVRKETVGLGIAGAIFAGFIGGLLLNIMPCVLPVIGLKIVSFVEQAGHNRRKAFALNVWYSLGLLFVFFILASLAVGPQHLGWGELFGRAWFTITLAAVVFVMSLSFMGVWEVPLPTFLGSGKAGELASQEGAVGAFFKGALTTLLATPCSAPFLAPALVWATAQPAWLTYAVFISVGFGMASPYLLIGAFPELLRFLPKPGAWMETFKTFMGFVLMGTVVYLLAVLKPNYVVPTVGFLFGLAFMCWWVGRSVPVGDFMARLRTWAQGAAVVCVIWIVMFPGFDLGRFRYRGLAAVMAGQSAPLQAAAATGPASGVVGPKTVLVAFTASWCQTCHVNESLVLDTDPVIQALRRLGVVTVKADWSHDSPEVSGMLEVLNSKQIPVIAIFSAQNPNHPTVFRGGYTQDEILKALEKAGPSPGA